MSVPPGRPQQRLTAPQVLLIAVVCVLVLLLVVLLVQRATSGSAPAADATAAPSAATTAPDDDAAAGDGLAPDDGVTPADEGEPTYFASPSGNIACAITVDSADCVIASFTYEADEAQQCDEDAAGGHLRVEPAGASMPCEPLVVAGDVPALAYGETVAAHGFTCESEESGVSCRHDGSGSGFTVARAEYELF